jgi:ABC-2 type transport system ATP-binding protein
VAGLAGAEGEEEAGAALDKKSIYLFYCWKDVMELSVEAIGLSKRYPSVLALDNVKLKVEAGKLFALLGPNGAGKTTLMRILTTQIDVTSGSAKVFGKDVTTDGGEVRKLVSYVPQEMSVWTDITGYENLLIYSKIYGIDGKKREGAIKSALKTMDLLDVAGNLVNTYSGGMVRKLEIASAIMVEPKILFLDEPTIGLDPSARRTVWDKLKWLNRKNGTSVFFSTHYMDEADDYADEIAIISRGKVMKVGSPEELKASVGNETVEIEATARLDGGLVKRIGRIPGIGRVSIDGSRLVAHAKSSDEAINPIMNLLMSSGVSVKSVSSSKPTMDDVFLKYTKGKEQKTLLADIKRARARIRRG